MTLVSPRTLLVAAAAVVAVGLLAVGGWLWHSSGQHRAMSAYAAALTQAQSAQGPQAAPDAREAAIRGLESALTQYSSGSGAAEVAYQLGNLRFEGQQYSQAPGAWELAGPPGATRTPQAPSPGAVAP